MRRLGKQGHEKRRRMLTAPTAQATFPAWIRAVPRQVPGGRPSGEAGQDCNAFLEPLRARRAHYEAHLDEVRDILRDGTQRANEIANRNMDAILRHMGLFNP
jgi:hypothetical protein